MSTSALSTRRSRFGLEIRKFLRGLLPVVGRVPMLAPLAHAAHARYFERVRGNVRLFHGIYPNFAEAKRAVKVDRYLSYDNEASAHRVDDEWLRMWPYDYPILYWLATLLPECRLVLDWGGNIGLKYFTYRKYLTYSAALRWCVSDVPAVVAAGQRVAEREQTTRLIFTTGLEELATADLVLAAGSLQFIEDPFDALRSAPRLPRHLLICKLPAHDGPTVATLQNMGTAICPYWLFNRTEFLAKLDNLGYELVDDWTSPDCACDIPLHSDYSIGAYAGFYLRQRSVPVGSRGQEEGTLGLR